MAKKVSQTEKYDEEAIRKLLKKKVFVRAAASTVMPAMSAVNTSVNEYFEAIAPNLRQQRITQDKFLAELDPRSHDINNKTLYPDKTVKGDDGTITITEIARVSVSLQVTIATKQCVHLWAKHPKFTSKRGSNPDLFARFKEYWTERNAQSALYLMAKAALTTGDGAICFFMNNGKLSYKNWSYKEGDMLIPIYKSNGVDLDKFVRRYYSIPEGKDQAVDTIDIYSDKTYTQLQQDGSKWIVSEPEKTHGFSQIPIAYHREPDVAWGAGQDLIDKIERLLSDVRESNAYFAFGIMFLAGDDINVLPPKTSQGKVITSTDSQSSAKLLEQNDMSGAIKFEYEQYTKQLYRNTGTVIIDPEILKGGDQSGAYIKNLYNDAIQYAMDAKPRWQPALEKIVSIVKEALELEDGDLAFRELVIISDPDIYVPMNVAEETRLVNESLVAGSVSVETASQNNIFATPDEYSRIKEETPVEQTPTPTPIPIPTQTPMKVVKPVNSN